MQHLKAAGSRHSVVMSQNKIPFFGKSGTPRIEFATSSFFSFSNIAPGVCCCDTTIERLGLLAGERVCDNSCLKLVLQAGVSQGQGDRNQLRTNMRPQIHCRFRDRTRLADLKPDEVADY